MTTEADKKVDEAGEEEEEQLEQQELGFYMKPGVAYTIVEKEWVRFCVMTAPIYCIHLFWMCYGVDAYSSYERHITCAGAETEEKASAVYDTWLLLCVVFHMLEWIRQTVFVTTALVGVNLIAVVYSGVVIIPFGIIAMLGGIIAGAASDADCKEKQSSRSTFLLLQILALILTLITSGGHILVMKIKGKEWCHEVYIREEEEDDD